ncbi:MAG TPA: hypothetical protein VGW33_02595, partial [Terriglobia bacterium]|nr:hypothetical protein [Terriglobia bacterium]
MITRSHNPKYQALAILVLALIGTLPLRKAIDAAVIGRNEAESPLYVSSGETARRLALGYDGLLADIYWTRVVQYYGRERLKGLAGTAGPAGVVSPNRYHLLGPLLRVTTAFDPH